MRRLTSLLLVGGVVVLCAVSVSADRGALADTYCLNGIAGNNLWANAIVENFDRSHSAVSHYTGNAVIEDPTSIQYTDLVDNTPPDCSCIEWMFEALHDLDENGRISAGESVRIRVRDTCNSDVRYYYLDLLSNDVWRFGLGVGTEAGEYTHDRYLLPSIGGGWYGVDWVLGRYPMENAIDTNAVDDLMPWVYLHAQDDAGNPLTCDSLQLIWTGTDTWLDARAPKPMNIVDISDVPADQGGSVSVRWQRSPLDETRSGIISEYSIWRATPWSATNVNENKYRDQMSLADALLKPSVRIVSSVLGNFAWEQVGSVTPHNFEYYSFTAPTLFDSTATNDGKHYFLVSAHSVDGITFWDSDPDSGYSVDNLAPPAPLLLSVSSSPSGASIIWRAPQAPDVQNYRIYRDTVPRVTATPQHLIASPADTLFTDGPTSSGVVRYYRVSGVDFAGNEGALSNELSTNPCQCACHGDFACDGVVNVFDVVASIEIAFRGNSPTPDPNASCPYSPMDVNCDSVINVFDVVKTVNVAFRGAIAETEYCGPCGR